MKRVRAAVAQKPVDDTGADAVAALLSEPLRMLLDCAVDVFLALDARIARRAWLNALACAPATWLARVVDALRARVAAQLGGDAAHADADADAAARLATQLVLCSEQPEFNDVLRALAPSVVPFGVRLASSWAVAAATLGDERTAVQEDDSAMALGASSEDGPPCARCAASPVRRAAPRVRRRTRCSVVERACGH